jgi:hypothetical protein
MVILSLAPALALAQGNSVLVGTVRDTSTQAPIASVLVTATSAAMQGEQHVVTDATGEYRVPQLPPGTYTLRFEKESHRPFSRTGIDIPADWTLRVNVELLPENAGSELVTVVGTPPTVDVGSSAIGATVDKDFIRNIALSRSVNRSFDSFAVVAPQANADLYGVGISGSTSPENQVLIDGLSVVDPGVGLVGTPLTSEFMEEVNVLTGGYMPEYGRSTGGIISAVTRSGGNEFHGSIWGTFGPSALRGTPAPVDVGTGVVTSVTKPANGGEFGATLGGYFVKDRLWFFVGFEPSYLPYFTTRSFNIANQDGTFTPIPKSGQRVRGDFHSYNFISKLNYLISPDNRIGLSVMGTPSGGTAAGGYGSGTYNATSGRFKSDALDIVGEWNSSFFEKRLLVDMRAGWHHEESDYLPIDGSGLDVNDPTRLAGTPNITGARNVPVTTLDDQVPASVKQACAEAVAAGNTNACGVTQFLYGGPGRIGSFKLDSVQAKATFTYLLTAVGHHVFKAGVDLEISQSGGTSAFSGLVRWTLNGLGTLYTGRRWGFLTGPGAGDFVMQDLVYSVSKRNTLGGFLQDSWSVLDRVTLNLGLRYDSLSLKGADGVTRIALNDQLSPRIGIVWDPTQQGRSKIYANYAQYFENIPLDIATRELTTAGLILALYPASRCNPLSGQGALEACNAAISPFGGRAPNRYWRVSGSVDVVPVDPNLKSPRTDEVVAGAEYEVFAHARLGASYTYRNLRRTVEDMSNDEANSFFIGNPGEGIASSFPAAKRTYNAVTVSLDKKFSDLWLAKVSYTYSTLSGNYDGLFRPEDGQLDPNINSTFDLKSLLANQEGRLAADINHQVKVFLAKEFVLLPTLSISLGSTVIALSGTPINYLGGWEFYGPAQSYILTRGSGGRLPWNVEVDVKGTVNFRLSRDSTVAVSVEVFNLFNSQRATGVDLNYTYDTVLPIFNATSGTVPAKYGGICSGIALSTCSPGTGSLPKPGPSAAYVALPGPDGTFGAAVNPHWGRPTVYQLVRSFRFGVRFNF